MAFAKYPKFFYTVCKFGKPCIFKSADKRTGAPICGLPDRQCNQAVQISANRMKGYAELLGITRRKHNSRRL